MKDNSDGQYAGFRDNIPYLAILLVVQPLLRRLYESLFSSTPVTENGHTAKTTTTSANALMYLSSRLTFDFISGLLFIAALHGFSALKVLTILYINYCIAFRIPRKYMPGVTWAVNVAILFANELGRGYKFSSMAESFAPFYTAAPEVGKFMDSWGGLIPRWEVLFNITILRLISFNMDYCWSTPRDRAGSPLEVCMKVSYLVTYANQYRRSN